MNSPSVQQNLQICRTPQQSRLGFNSGRGSPSTVTITDDSQIVTITVGELKSIVKEAVDSSSIKQRAKDKKVDPIVKTGVHSIVAELTRQDKTWNFSVGFKEDQNPQYTEDVLTALSNKIGHFDRHMAHRACRTYFLTLKNRDKNKKANKLNAKQKEQRKRQRKSSARERRLAIVQTMAEGEEKDNLKGILQDNTFISSEESEEVSDSSDTDSDDMTPKRKVFVKRVLPWRSEYLNKAFQTLDSKRTKRQKRCRKGGASLQERRVGTKISSREEPEDAPQFAVQEFESP